MSVVLFAHSAAHWNRLRLLFNQIKCVHSRKLICHCIKFADFVLAIHFTELRQRDWLRPWVNTRTKWNVSSFCTARFKSTRFLFTLAINERSRIWNEMNFAYSKHDGESSSSAIIYAAEWLRVMFLARIFVAKLKSGHFHNDECIVNQTSGAQCLVNCSSKRIIIYNTQNCTVFSLSQRYHTADRAECNAFVLSSVAATISYINRVYIFILRRCGVCASESIPWWHSHQWCMWHHRMTISQMVI